MQGLIARGWQSGHAIIDEINASVPEGQVSSTFTADRTAWLCGNGIDVVEDKGRARFGAP